jgi:uncharacterized protein YcfL
MTRPVGKPNDRLFWFDAAGVTVKAMKRTTTIWNAGFSELAKRRSGW